ncbi:hypothetical protein CY35_07G114900 [Sphagnum magellanicum]|uniref:Uncharacterized protein n=1 Tax=Sphagnum magellanicum TaxID=128215 RepID=A0ACB8HP42_9BRYO|nr:hypothetical protein CY35_07G114900 [Sphagnum magellanicum]
MTNQASSSSSTSSSLLSSLGSVLPHFSLHRATNVSPKRHPALQKFESRLAEKLEALKLAGEELGFLSIDWFLQSMTVVLASHSNVEALIPDLQFPLSDKDDKWMDEYLDDSAKLLDVCNVLKEGISDVEHYQMLVQVALVNLDNRESFSEAKYHRARNALQDCKEAIKTKDTEYKQGQPKSKLENCSSMLRTMGEKLVNPKGVDAVKGNGFLNAIYGAKVTTIFLCGLLVIALACKPKRPLVNLSVTNQYLWSSSLISLQHTVKEETDRRKNGGSIALLCELDSVDSSVRRLHQLIDRNLLEKKFPLHKDQAGELRQLVEDLSKNSAHLGSGLGPLEQYVNELFRILIDSRLALLDILSKSKKRQAI